MRERALIAACLTCLLTGQALAQDDPPAAPVPQPSVPEPSVAAPADPVRIESEGETGAGDDTQGGDSPTIGALVVPSDGSLEELPIMTIDQDRLFAGTAWGRRVQAELARQGNDLSEENERLLQQFSREEEELTRLRDTLPPDEFRIRADEFDRKVVEIRHERDTARQELQQLPQKERETFYAQIMPILAKLMQERQAVVVLDQRLVLIQAQSIDVTDELIARVDAELGEGPGLTSPPAAQDGAAQDGAPAETPANPGD